jgi:hypothetical protein
MDERHTLALGLPLEDMSALRLLRFEGTSRVLDLWAATSESGWPWYLCESDDGRDVAMWLTTSTNDVRYLDPSK